MSRYSPRTARLYVHEDPFRGRLLVSWWASDAWVFATIKSSWRGCLARHGDAVWSPSDKAWSVPAYRRRAVEDWAAATFRYDAIIWPSDEDFDDDEPASGWDRTAHSNQDRDPLAAAYARLHLLPTAPPELVTAAHRLAIKAAHPDAGGSHEQAVAVNQAISTIREGQRHAARAS